MLCSQAPGAKIEAFLLALDDDGGGMYIWYPAAVGMPLGVTYIMTELR